MKADRAIENYPEKNCPTILVYKNGDIAKQVVTLTTVGGVKINMLTIDNLLVEVGAVPGVGYEGAQEAEASGGC